MQDLTRPQLAILLKALGRYAEDIDMLNSRSITSPPQKAVYRDEMRLIHSLVGIFLPMFEAIPYEEEKHDDREL